MIFSLYLLKVIFKSLKKGGFINKLKCQLFQEGQNKHLLRNFPFFKIQLHSNWNFQISNSFEIKEGKIALKNIVLEFYLNSSCKHKNNNAIAYRTFQNKNSRLVKKLKKDKTNFFGDCTLEGKGNCIKEGNISWKSSIVNY